jgi:hypothetical protein
MQKLPQNAKGFAHTVLLLFVIVSVGIVGTYYLTKSHADTVTLAAPDLCTANLSNVTVQTVDALGNTIGAVTNLVSTTTTLAQQLTYKIGGDVVTQILPPASWTPLKATAQELTAYDFPERPTDSTALAKWNAIMAHYTGPGARGLCETSNTNALLSSSPFKSRNWAGAIAKKGANDPSFVSADMSWSQTGFTSGCGSAARYSTWPGIGGVGGKPLIQAGTDVYTRDGQHTIYAWWELYDEVHKFPAVAFTGSAGAIKGGHEMFAQAGYRVSSAGKHYASFLVMDYTTGKTWTMSVGKKYGTYKTVPITQLYNGSYAEAITEAGGKTVNGKTVIQPLRKSSTGGTLIRSFHIGNYQVAPSKYGTYYAQQYAANGTTLLQSSSFRGGDGAFGTKWHGCN